MPVDPHKVVGGTVWANVLHALKRSRGIYGLLVDSKWLQGTVVEVITNRAEGAK
jgi:hypothetical protein